MNPRHVHEHNSNNFSKYWLKYFVDLCNRHTVYVGSNINSSSALTFQFGPLIDGPFLLTPIDRISVDCVSITLRALYRRTKCSIILDITTLGELVSVSSIRLLDNEIRFERQIPFDSSAVELWLGDVFNL